MLNLSEALAFIALQTFFADPAETQFRTNMSGESGRGGSKCWPEAIQYLFYTYAVTFAISEVLEDLQEVKLKVHKKEDAYRKGLNESIFRCHNVHSGDEKITLYVYGLSRTSHMVVSHHRENVHIRDLTFESLCQFAKSEDEAYRAPLHNITFNVKNQQLKEPSIRPAWIRVGP